MRNKISELETHEQDDDESEQEKYEDHRVDDRQPMYLGINYLLLIYLTKTIIHMGVSLKNTLWGGWRQREHASQKVSSPEGALFPYSCG